MAEIKVGQQAIVTAKRYGHRFDIGEVVTIKEVTNHNYKCVSEGQGWYLMAEEFEIIGESINKIEELENRIKIIEEWIAKN